MSLAQFRQRIDAIDTKIVTLLNQRAALAQQIGAEKKREGLKIYEPSREQQVLGKVERLRRAPLDSVGLSRIYRALMLTMRLLQKSPTPGSVAARKASSRQRVRADSKKSLA